MADKNRCNIIGNLTSDAEYRETDKGCALTIRVATNRYVPTKDGNGKEVATYLDVKFFGKRAKGLWVKCGPAAENPCLCSGDKVVVEGRMVNNNWTDKDGNGHYDNYIAGTDIEFEPMSAEARAKKALAQAA